MTARERAEAVCRRIRGSRPADVPGVAAAIQEAVAEEQGAIQELIVRSTGPTGGWLVSPAQLSEAISARGKQAK